MDTAEEIVTASLTHVAAALKDVDARVQSAAAQILVREEKRSVPLLIPLVEKGQGKQRLWAASILGEIGVKRRIRRQRPVRRCDHIEQLAGRDA